MLNLITGRSGCGKTEYLRSILKSEAGLGDNKLILIVPEQFSFESERAFLEQLPAKEAQSIEVLSFTRLSDFVGRSLGGLSGTQADEGTKIIIMMRSLEGLRDSLNWYSSHCRSVSLAKELVKLIGEFKREKITPGMLEEASKLTPVKTLSSKLHEIALIYSAYDALFSQSFIDESTLSDRLCKALRKNNFFSGYTVCVDAFKGFTGQEFEILVHIISQAKEVYIALTTPDIYAPDPSMIFGSVNDTAKKLISIAKEANIKVRIVPDKEIGLSEGLRFSSPALKFLEKNIFYPTDSLYTEPTEDITLVSASTINDECAFIAAQARRLMRTESMRLRDMAVIVRNEEDYRFELISAFKRFGIPVFEDKRQPISNQPLISLCKSVMQILIGGFTTENILRYLKSGLSPLSDIEASELENYALLWNFSAKAWGSEFTNSPAGMDELHSDKEKNENAERLAELNKMRSKIIPPLKRFKSKIKDTNALEISTAFYEFLVKTEVPERLKQLSIELNADGYPALAIEQNRVFEILMDILGKLGTVYGDTPTDLDTYYSLFCAVLSATDLGSIPHTLEEITIGSADRIRLSDAKIVFAAGCAEGIFPAVPVMSGLLSARDRKALSELGIELSQSSELKACEERFIAYSAVTLPREKLFISYHQNNEESGGLAPSVIFENTKSLFGDSIQYIDTQLLSPEFFAETKDGAFGIYAENYGLIDQMNNDSLQSMHSIRSILEQEPLYSHRLHALDNVSCKKPFRIENPETATKLFRENMYLSASRVDTYHKCAFEYFCKYGIGAKPRKKAELSANIRGTVIHYVLEQMIKEHGKDGLLGLSPKDRQMCVDKWLDTYLYEVIGGFEDKTIRFKYLYTRLRLSLYDVINRLCAEFESSEFVPCDFELSIDNEAAKQGEGVPSYSLELDDGGQLEIHGSVDRVDKYEKDGITYIRVVDYKSGGKDFVLSDILYGLNMQMLIYLFAIESGGKERYGDVKSAGILYYPAKRSSVSMTAKHMPKEELEDKTIKAGRGSGLFLLDENTLEAMEKGLEGRFIPIVSKTKKDGASELSGNLITAEQLGKLRVRIDSILCEMAKSLHKGLIPAYPAFNSGAYANTCKYCDYSDVCGIEDGDRKEIQKLNNSTVFEELQDGFEELQNGEQNRGDDCV